MFSSVATDFGPSNNTYNDYKYVSRVPFHKTFPTLLKDCFSHLFHGFRNKYLNKISLDSMLFYHN